MMKVTFFFNYLNHHQVLVADAMYELLGEDFIFVATYPCDPKELKGGLDYSTRPYCILATKSNELNFKAHKLNIESDVCVFGAGNLEWEKERASTEKLSFEVSERWLKKGWRNLFSPRLLKWWWLYQTLFRNKPFYRLCCNAFTANDDVKLRCYKGRHFKWGYFTQVDERNYVEASLDVSTPGSTTLMWCSRFLVLKHPELPVQMAAKLKDKGYKFHIRMYGDEGNAAKHDTIYPRKKLQKLIEQLGVQDCVELMGSRPNNEVLDAMRESEIFLFTSDRQEGWGAVANESMANGCALVASDAIGSVPYLIDENRNGLIFHTGDVDSLYSKVKYLLDNPDICKCMAKTARQSMVDIWSPVNAAKSLLTLIDDLQREQECSILKGPCSKA